MEKNTRIEPHGSLWRIARQEVKDQKFNVKNGQFVEERLVTCMEVFQPDQEQKPVKFALAKRRFVMGRIH